MTMPFSIRAVALAVALASNFLPAAALAAPTPVPGGADERAGVSGDFSQTLFNGSLRLRGMALRAPGPDDKMRPNGSDPSALVFTAIVSNGLHRNTHGFFNATLADANGITVTGRPLDSGWDLEQGAASRTTIGFSIPKDFVPTKLVLVEAAATAPKAFRIAIRPSDLPPAP